METLGARFAHSRTALGREATALVRRTRAAGAGFVSETREAGSGFVAGVRGEAEGFRAWAEARRDLLGDELRQSLRPERLEQRLLRALRTALARLSKRLDERVTALEPAASPSTKRAPKGRKPKAAPKSGANGAPLPGYDGLSAKEVVARLAALTPAEKRAVEAWEKRHKKRATVLRALDRQAA